MKGKVLVANRGAIACRVLRTLRKLGYRSVAVFSEADRHSRHVREADEAVCVGAAPARDSYLQADRILEVAKQTAATAIHPGYGFLSENAGFADACAAAGVVFLGPTGDQMRAFGLKHEARRLAEVAGVAVPPGTPLLVDGEAASAAAGRIGYPVMVKSTAGGGGIGMRVCASADELGEAFAAVQRLGTANFGDGGVFLEKFVARARHVEVQIFGDGEGKVIALGERDCSLQRRNQKVVEETPAPGLSDSVRAELLAAAVRLGESVNYRSAGTVEFLYDDEDGSFYFLEVNTRLQVEHGVTEEVTGVDLVEWMVRLGHDEMLPLDGVNVRASGCSIQARVYAEDANQDFRPCTGTLSEAVFPAGVRCDSWVERGTEVSGFYDPLLAKVIVKADTRDEAIDALGRALDGTVLAGFETNLGYLKQVVACREFAEARMTTRFLDSFDYRPVTVDVIDGGTMTTVQDWPGRTGYWDVGVPPSGPMDGLSFRLGNCLLGNDEAAAGLEITASGPVLIFNTATVICVTGAGLEISVDGEVLPMWQALPVAAGAKVKVGRVGGVGQRAYLCVAGGIEVPEYLGSRSTFTLGGFGGHAGRALLAGDVLHLATGAGAEAGKKLPDELRPAMANRWEVAVLYGPHGAPDFFTDDDIEMFFSTDWEVHYNSARTGVRLVGPKPKWAREDGGEAGLHPSNLHDNAYAVGAVDFTGDMPVILGPDGPSLGGFVCPATLAKAELWKLGQLKPGDKVRFVRVDRGTAAALENRQDELVKNLAEPGISETAILAAARKDEPAVVKVVGDVVYRQSGDDNVLVEFGDAELDLNLRFRAHALMLWIKEAGIDGVLGLTPGIRTLQVNYDNRRLPLEKMLGFIERGVQAFAEGGGERRVKSRIVHLPLSWDDAATQLAIDKYVQSVRPDAPWCPSNIEFIRRINGLESVDEVKRILFEASYLVMGLGDVYLGAPVATPVDPRHRLVTTKYNPARTWTPENAVGIGGAYLCVYGMEGPGGYQFVGRTCQMWNKYRETAEFEAGKPWLLRFFDQIRFYEVGADELLQFREDFVQGKVGLKIEEAEFCLDEYNAFVEHQREGIEAAKARQQSAFEAERARWVAAGQDVVSVDEPEPEIIEELDLPDGCEALSSPVSGSIWKVLVAVGDSVEEGDTLVVVESMKMEINFVAEQAGTVREILCAEGKPVIAGQRLVVVEEKL